MYGGASYAELAIARIRDPNARKHGAIVATMATDPTIRPDRVESLEKVQVNLKTEPGR